MEQKEDEEDRICMNCYYCSDMWWDGTAICNKWRYRTVIKVEMTCEHWLSEWDEPLE